MYAFVMRPESLPRSYQDFIQKTGPVAEPVYKAVRDNCRGCAVDVATLSSYLSGRKGFSSINLVEFPSIIPCSIIHPDTKSCLAHNATAASDTFRKTFPLYFSLTFVPFVVLRLNKVPSFLLLFFFFCSIWNYFFYFMYFILFHFWRRNWSIPKYCVFFFGCSSKTADHHPTQPYWTGVCVGWGTWGESPEPISYDI